MCTESVTPLLRFLKISFSSAFVIQIPLCPGGYYLTLFSDSWRCAVRFYALDLGSDFSWAVLPLWFPLWATSCLAAGEFCLLSVCFRAHWNLFTNVACCSFQWDPYLFFSFVFLLSLYLQSFHNFLYISPRNIVHSDVKKIEMALHLLIKLNSPVSTRRTHRSAFEPRQMAVLKAVAIAWPVLLFSHILKYIL